MELDPRPFTACTSVPRSSNKFAISKCPLHGEVFILFPCVRVRAVRRDRGAPRETSRYPNRESNLTNHGRHLRAPLDGKACDIDVSLARWLNGVWLLVDIHQCNHPSLILINRSSFRRTISTSLFLNTVSPLQTSLWQIDPWSIYM